MPACRRPTLTRPRLSRRYGKNFETTTLCSTTHRTRHCGSMEALRGGISRYAFLSDSRFAPLSLLHSRVSDFASPCVSSTGNRSWRAGLGSGTTTSLS
jgi:hypothetical protein